jgi:hypothetical protein
MESYVQRERLTPAISRRACNAAAAQVLADLQADSRVGCMALFGGGHGIYNGLLLFPKPKCKGASWAGL